MFDIDLCFGGVQHKACGVNLHFKLLSRSQLLKGHCTVLGLYPTFFGPLYVVKLWKLHPLDPTFPIMQLGIKHLLQSYELPLKVTHTHTS